MSKIKNWKKQSERKNRVVWYGNDGDTIEVSYIPNYHGEDKHWLVGANGMLHIKKFKTKKEAINSAIKYMRINDMG